MARCGGSASHRAEIRTFLDGLGALKDADSKKWAKRILKAVRKQGPKISRKSGETFTWGGLSAKVYTAGARARGTGRRRGVGPRTDRRREARVRRRSWS